MVHPLALVLVGTDEETSMLAVETLGVAVATKQASAEVEAAAAASRLGHFHSVEATTAPVRLILARSASILCSNISIQPKRSYLEESYCPQA